MDGEYMTPTQDKPSNAAPIIFGAIKIGLSLLGRRALLILSLLGSFALFAYTIFHPDGYTITTAALFTVFTFIPLLFSVKGQT